MEISEETMIYDIHNQEKKVKGRFTHSFTHKCGAGFRMKHEKGLVKHTIGVIASMGVELIVELGTFQGGFTKLLEDAMPDVEIHTFDNVNVTKSTRKYFGQNVSFHVCDVLNDNPLVRDLLCRHERKLLYCDNGRKRQEVAMYHGCLATGDFIGVHDWGNEIWWDDIIEYLSDWEMYKWPTLEMVGVTSRFWRKGEE